VFSADGRHLCTRADLTLQYARPKPHPASSNIGHSATRLRATLFTLEVKAIDWCPDAGCDLLCADGLEGGGVHFESRPCKEGAVQSMDGGAEDGTENQQWEKWERSGGVERVGMNSSEGGSGATGSIGDSVGATGSWGACLATSGLYEGDTLWTHTLS
jgi:hypothetical protein